MLADSTEVRTLPFPEVGTALPRFIPQYTPTIWTVDLPAGVTDGSPWQRANPQAGVRELDWFEGHLHEFAAYEGMWIAILGHRVVASGRSMAELRQEIEQHGIVDALVVRVPGDVSRREYFIG